MLHKNLKNRNFYNWIIFEIGVNLITLGMIGFIVLLSSKIGTEYSHHTEYLRDLSIISTVIAVFIIGPILEELIFRGFLIWITSKFTEKFFFINLIQAFLFGLAHLNPIQIFYSFIGGLIYGKVKKEFGTIWAPIILHSVGNFVGLFPSLLIRIIYKINNIPLEIEGTYSTTEKIIGIVLALILVLLGSLIAYKMNKKINLVTKDIFVNPFKKVIE